MHSSKGPATRHCVYPQQTTTTIISLTSYSTSLHPQSHQRIHLFFIFGVDIFYTTHWRVMRPGGRRGWGRSFKCTTPRRPTGADWHKHNHRNATEDFSQTHSAWQKKGAADGITYFEGGLKTTSPPPPPPSTTTTSTWYKHSLRCHTATLNLVVWGSLSLSVWSLHSCAEHHMTTHRAENIHGNTRHQVSMTADDTLAKH